MTRIAPPTALDQQHRGNPEIEYLRALAILFVIVMHAPLLCIPFPAGRLEQVQNWIHPATGVDLFFIISGYLIGRSFVAPYEANEHCGAENRVQRIAAFWVRRFYRLLPASALWASLTFLACIVSRKPALWLEPNVMFIKSVAAMVAVRNFEESHAPSPFGYFWSLSVENQFYLALPVLLLLVARRWRVPGLLGLCALNAVWRPGGENWWLFRYDGLVYGLLLFQLERSGLSATLGVCLPSSRTGRAALMLCAGAVVLVAPLTLLDFHPLGWTVTNWGGFVLVFAASRQVGVITLPAPLRPAMLWLGARSYSLYLCHIPIWFAVIDLWQRFGWGSEALVPTRFAASFLCSLIAADLTFRHLELPMQERGRSRAATLRPPPLTPLQGPPP